MEKQLDNLFVVTERINEKIREHKTNPTTELCNAIHALPPLRLKRVEDSVNAEYGDMSAQERSECLKRWDDSFAVLIDNLYNGPVRYYSSTKQANAVLCKIFKNQKVTVSVTHKTAVDAKFKQYHVFYCCYIESAYIKHIDGSEDIRVHFGVKNYLQLRKSDCLELFGRVFPDGHKLSSDEIIRLSGPKLDPSYIVQSLQYYKDLRVDSSSICLKVSRITMDVPWE